MSHPGKHNVKLVLKLTEKEHFSDMPEVGVILDRLKSITFILLCMVSLQDIVAISISKPFHWLSAKVKNPSFNKQVKIKYPGLSSTGLSGLLKIFILVLLQRVLKQQSRPGL
ncbi:TPA: hypothetical protein ACTW34_003119 [Raoultella planticola]